MRKGELRVLMQTRRLIGLTHPVQTPGRLDNREQVHAPKAQHPAI